MVRILVFIGLACLASMAPAEEAAPAKGAGSTDFKAGIKRMGSDIGSAGKHVGQEFAKAGKQVGHGTAKTAREASHKVSTDVKTGNFKPRAQGKSPKTDSGRGDDQR